MRPKEDVKKIFEAPMVLITEGINPFFQSVSAVCENDVVFRSSLTAIKSLNKDKKTLQIISGILNSSFFSYFCLQTFSSSGNEREQSHDEENKSVPFMESDEIVSLVSAITELKLQKNSQLPIFSLSTSSEIDNKIKELDSAIISAFSFTEMEKDILDYSVNVTIPMIMKHNDYEEFI